jgi:pSer/pThr/pTyr-binding forkhead associated (FHA) protein
MVVSFDRRIRSPRGNRAMEVTLVVVGGRYAGKEIPVSTQEFTIGRGQECQFRLKSDVVSRKHCAIVIEKGGVVLRDLGSTNGTFLNGQRIQERQELKNGDHIAIGVLELEVRLAVSVAGKMKPKVRTVQEAAARTVASAASSDWDISRWLEIGEEKEKGDEQSVVAPVKTSDSADDTVTGKGLTETGKVAAKTAALPARPAKTGAKTKGKTPTKAAGQFQKLVKPMAENSGEAANEMLRKFFSRKKG